VSEIACIEEVEEEKEREEEMKGGMMRKEGRNV
jgi:hypothetical protein